MLRIEIDRTRKYCDGLNRRSFVQLGVAGMASVGLPQLLRARAASANEAPRGNGASTILVWLDGGPSHLDLVDMKPEAPREIRGIWNPVATNVPGIEITEMFPKLARTADKFSIVRSLYHDSGDHFTAAHRMLTTKDMGVSGASTGGRFPSLGAIVTRECGARHPEMLPYVGVPHASSIGLTPGYFGANFLGAHLDPFQTEGSPNDPNFQVQNLNLAPGLSMDRLDNRLDLLTRLDQIPRTIDASGMLDTMDQFENEAARFVAGKRARDAFDIKREDPRLRDQYGRHSWGQSVLLSRRLVDAGATFVTVHLGGWDHHWDMQKGLESCLPMVDSAMSSLFSDLEQRGMLATTLVVLCGEFSRTPRMNDGGNGGPPLSMGTPGRDHWGNAMFCLLGGGGVRGGQVIGSTDRKGERPLTQPVRPDNVHATIYTAMGIDPSLHLFDPSGRPTPVLEDPTPIDGLM